MEESKETKQVNTEEIKNQTASTVNEVKETIKNVDIKKDTLETKGFLKEIFTDPLGKIKEIVADDSNKCLKYAIIILAIWIIAVFIRSLYVTSGLWSFKKAFDVILMIIKDILAPVLSVLTMSVIILLFNKNSKKKLTTIIAAVTTAEVPVVISSVLKLTLIISSQMSKLTTPFALFCSSITLVLMYFTAKSVFGVEKNSEFIKKFILIEACYYVAYFVFTFLGIYI